LFSWSCVIRPTTAITAIILGNEHQQPSSRCIPSLISVWIDVIGVYHEGDFSMSYGYIYVLIVINISVAYAFMVLATFYTILKSKLKPFEPIGKFLCIKFVIFFAFWQSVMITGMVRLGWIEKLGKIMFSHYFCNIELTLLRVGEYGPDLVATGLQVRITLLHLLTSLNLVLFLCHLYRIS